MIKTALDHFALPPAAKLLGWHLLDARPAEGWIRIGFDGKPEFCNPAGFIQGGILSAMLDDTMGPAVFIMTEGKLYTATITMTVNFLAPAKVGPITGEASVTQLGKTIAFVVRDGSRFLRFTYTLGPTTSIPPVSTAALVDAEKPRSNDPTFLIAGLLP